MQKAAIHTKLSRENKQTQMAARALRARATICLFFVAWIVYVDLSFLHFYILGVREIAFLAIYTDPLCTVPMCVLPIHFVTLSAVNRTSTVYTYVVFLFFGRFYAIFISILYFFK